MSVQIQKSFEANERGSGKLYLVATPIGNLEDMTYRAIRTLKEVDIIAAEDTRQTRKLLSHFEISPQRLLSYHDHNKIASGPELVRLIIEGKNLALVSDAGLPAISDPGRELVQLAIQEDIAVIPIPGANAALSALIVSGLPTERFHFAGFLPRDKKDRELLLKSLGEQEGTFLLYESPHRLIKTLEHLLEVCGDRDIALARELTKRFEEIVRASVIECLAWLEEHPPLGEYCIVVEGASAADLQVRKDAWWQELSLEAHVTQYEQEKDVSRKDAMKLVAADRGVSKRDIYNALLD
ncbi:16S rRNA (cytidine1402-2'-O)-methyltransferase [Paenibacillus shirakamiensis]|uniref:Ribosomal RNA small subunit methyltransferase I n=1 Tax=Paenibacillus shirakamiensis TaxID=1265935 RepID=A0ABS4JLV1_9BACL|nr:16S rRNA (cytidine(1402)-2'-O)-methyltransferase [Paenibacillus shirakamiensis]MBP2002688.1 16S rRNA (cytidine1402-2'-O)-methyltransferase [Paenibacillus shirakamiensis]